MAKTNAPAIGQESRLKSASYQVKRHAPGVLYGIFRYAFIIGMAYVLLLPILVMLTQSIRPAQDLANPSVVWIPSGVTWENMQLAWKLLKYPQMVLFTSRIVVISTVLSLISCSMAGYALARYRMKFSKLCIVIAVLTIIVPMQTYIVPLFTSLRYFSPLGISNLISAITGIPLENISLELTQKEWCYYVPAILGSGLRSGLFIIVFMNFFKGMPKELEDAARVDGCSEMRTFVQVMVPNAGAPFLVVTLFSIVWYWNDYYFAQMMMGEKNILATQLAVVKDGARSMGELATSSNANEAAKLITFAAALLFIIPPLVLYLYLQKFFVQSIERTGIVG